MQKSIRLSLHLQKHLIWYYTRNMAPSVDSYAAYLVILCAKSWVVVVFYFKHTLDEHILQNLNNPVHVECKYYWDDLASTTIVEVGWLFHNY